MPPEASLRGSHPPGPLYLPAERGLRLPPRRQPCSGGHAWRSVNAAGWARQLDLDVDAADASEPCLYLIPDYDTQEEAEELLEEVYEAIFEAELDYWHRDTGTWPAERTYSVFRKWFEVRFYPLIQDLVGEELTATEVDEEFIGELRTALEGLEQHT